MEQDIHTILLIEDNPGDARLIREMLREGCGDRCRVEHVERLGDGIARLAAGGVDLVLLDLSLPDAQGFETFARVHAEAPSVPIVVLTGLSDEEMARHAVQQGAQDYLPKGEVNEHGLVRSMLYAMERARGEAERLRLLAREQAARAEAEAERARVQTILQSASNAILFVDAESGRLTANVAAERLFGRPFVPEAGAEQYLGQVCHPDGRPLTRDELLMLRALRGEVVTEQEQLISRPDRSQVPVLSSAAPVWDPSGRVTGAVTIHHDITAIKELERMREEWTSVIAHDLRQPVAAITAYAGALSALAEQQPSLEPFGKRADNIAAAAGQLERMISDLLDMSRLGAGKLKLEPTVVDLPLLLHGVLDRAAEATRGHPTAVHMQEGLPRVWADPGRLEQVVVNLLSNAAKYGSPDTTLRLDVEQHDGEVQVAVTNEGAGITPEEIPRLFSRFYRTSGARAGGVPGLGLGLYVCRELVQAHGGRIWVESTPGQTTTFRFTLPVVPA